MLEVKFQCWDREYSQMYTNAWPFEHLVYVEMPQDEPEVQKRESSMHKVNGKWFYFLMRKDVDLRQYVGLPDKNDKDMYTDDIVLVEGARKGIVKFAHGTFYVSFLRNILEEHSVSLEAIATHNIEIIGNIYEHPQLLEQKGLSRG